MGENDNQSPSSPTSTNGWLPADLQMRIVSGLAVAAVAIGALYAGKLAFAILVCLIAAVMSWEWGRIVRAASFDTICWLHIVAVSAAAVLSGLGMAGLGAAALAIGAIAVLALSSGGSAPQLSAAGVLYTGLPAVALIWLRTDVSLGFQAVLFILLIVAATDTAAFAAGRFFGGPKLAPKISPGKTWSGLIGGVLCAALTAVLFSRITGTGVAYWLAPLGLLLGLVAQAGDLCESALKRRYGLKDASDLIPGHGGFMDRMDGIVTAAVAAALIAFAIDDYAPARALLYGS